MKRILGRFQDEIFAVMRVVAGFTFACHGAQKLFGVLGGARAQQPMMMVAGVVEFFGGLLIALGLFAGLAAFIASGEMASAYFMVHARMGLFPIVNKGELAVVYCFLFLFIAAHGAGKYSLDALRGGRSATS